MSLDINTFTDFVNYFEAYVHDKITGGHIGGYKSKHSIAYEALRVITNIELSIDNFAQFFMLAFDNLNAEEKNYPISLASFLLNIVRLGSTAHFGKSTFSDDDILVINGKLEKLKNRHGFRYTNPLDSSSQPINGTTFNNTISYSQAVNILDNLSELVTSQNSVNTDIAKAVRDEVVKYLGIKKQLTSTQVNEHCKKLGFTFQKILKKQNQIKILDTHLRQKTTPKDLSHRMFPTPHHTHSHKDLYVDTHNKIIEEAQIKMLENSKRFFESDIDILENDVVVYSSILEQHLPDFEDLKSKLKQRQEEILTKNFKSSSVKATKARATPYKVTTDSNNDSILEQIDSSFTETSPNSSRQHINAERNVSFASKKNANSSRNRSRNQSKSASRNNSKSRASNNPHNIPLLNTFPKTSNYHSFNNFSNQNPNCNLSLNNTRSTDGVPAFSSNSSNHGKPNNSTNQTSKKGSFFRKRQGNHTNY